MQRPCVRKRGELKVFFCRVPRQTTKKKVRNNNYLLSGYSPGDTNILPDVIHSFSVYVRWSLIPHVQ